MWDQVEDIMTAAAPVLLGSQGGLSDGESAFSSDDERDIQCEILEKQRDEANQRLSEIEHVSGQLLKEIDVLEMQFQIERSCRESAEALAVQVTKENKVLKRRSQMLMPLIAELPENMADVTFDPDSDPDSDPVGGDQGGPDENSHEGALLLSQVKIADLQASVDRLLCEKLQLEEQAERLSSKQVLLKEQLLVETEEKEALLRTMSKQNKTMNKIKRVSQLVTEEFTEMSERLEREQDLRQHAEVLARQMLVQRLDAGSTDTGLQLQQALEQVSSIGAALRDIQLYYQSQAKQPQGAVEEGGSLSELHRARQELERSEEERRALQMQLSEAHRTASRLQDRVKQLQDTLEKEAKTDQSEDTKSTPVVSSPCPPPPPPPLPPPPTIIINPLDAVRRRKKDGCSDVKQSQPAPMGDMKARAVDEMMERIKKGIVLRPTAGTQLGSQEDDSSWKDQRSEKRKSAVVELKGMLDTMKRKSHRRAASRKRISRNIGEAELLMVLQRRRRVMGENQDLPSTRDAQTPQPSVPVAGAFPWAGKDEKTPVLRRLKQNREKRDSHVRSSTLTFNQAI